MCITLRTRMMRRFWRNLLMERKKKIGKFLSTTLRVMSLRKQVNETKKNREKLKMAHACGTKSIAQYCYEERDLETGQEPTRTSTWRITRLTTRKIIGSMKNHMRLMDGLKPPSNRGQKINDELEKENEELRKQAEEDKESLESLKKENKEMTLQLESQVNNQEAQMQAQVQDILKAQLPAILRVSAKLAKLHQLMFENAGL